MSCSGKSLVTGKWDFERSIQILKLIFLKSSVKISNCFPLRISELKQILLFPFSISLEKELVFYKKIDHEVEYWLHVLNAEKRQFNMNSYICLELVSGLITIPCWMNDCICNSMLRYRGFKCMSVIVFHLFYRNVTNKNSTKMDSNSAR